MRCVSWNVNGLRAVAKKGFTDIFDAFDADIVALQETKLQEGQIELDLPGYHDFWSYAQRKGYSGTAVFSREEPLQAIHEVGVAELDLEGRVCALEFPTFWFVDVYTPNAQGELARIDHRMAWDDAFRDFCLGLEQGEVPAGYAASDPKPVIMCGDFNVAHNEIDLKHPGPNRGKPGFSDQERGKFGQLVRAGFVDTFRQVHPYEEDAYSWWSYRANARANNVGWRIDYFMVSKSVASRIEAAAIYADVFGSDHCPVALEIDL
ncbi:MAG: exodeoxyribonuclease III [Raoultibacter sp.]